jgi:hypothetical protein
MVKDKKLGYPKHAMEQLKKKYQKQKDFLNGDVKKKKLTNVENDKVNDIQESGTEMVRVGGDYDQQGNGSYKGVDCIVVKN